MRGSLTGATFLVALLTSTSAFAVVTTNHIYDRSAVYSNAEMCDFASSGESLADTTPAFGFGGCGRDPVGGDIVVGFQWADGQTANAVWSDPSGKNLAAGGPVLFPGTAAPGVHFDFMAGLETYRGFIEQSGDTFIAPWELRNGSSTEALVSVELTAVTIFGNPVMGFDTDNGISPGHGAGGFSLVADDTLSEYMGTINVTYSQFNNFAGTTDMFHRMTIDFVDPLAPGTSLVFRQDTDEVVPEPMSIGIIGAGAAAVALFRRRRA